MIHHIDEQLGRVTVELATTTAQLERAQKRNAEMIIQAATLAANLEDANITIQGHVATNSHLLSRNTDLLSRNSALRQQQLDMTATDKDHGCIHTTD